MQEQHMNALIQNPEWDDMWQKALIAPEGKDLKHSWAQALEEKIAQETTNLPAGMRTPTAEEVLSMKLYEEEYRKKNPRAKNREVRRAIQRKFNVGILPNT